MILVALGSNVAGRWGSPRQTIARALQSLAEPPTRLLAASTPLVTAPFGKRDQPDFVNAVARIETALPADELMRHLHGIERKAGRDRIEHWGPRTLDLDLLDYAGTITDMDEQRSGLVLPHPGIAERPFVLAPIAEIAPEWRHPVLGKGAGELLSALGPDAEGSEVSG